MEAVEALRSAPEDEARAQLAKALKDRNNYLAGKAATIIASRQFHDLIPNTIESFDRFLRDAVKTDPQCWAKNALVKALKDLAFDEPEVFLKGIAHIQLEPVWGGREDTAATLRSTCALALSSCRIQSFDALVHLTPLLADEKSAVRVDAARAMAQLNAREAILPLRLRCLTGDSESEVMGAAFAALISLDAESELPFVGRFLNHPTPEIRLEAAAAAALSREPAAIAFVKEYWQHEGDAQVRKDLLEVIRASNDATAAEFLLWILVEGSRREASFVLDALLHHRRLAEVSEKIESALAAREDEVLLEQYQQALKALLIQNDLLIS